MAKNPTYVEYNDGTYTYYDENKKHIPTADVPYSSKGAGWDDSKLILASSLGPPGTDYNAAYYGRSGSSDSSYYAGSSGGSSGGSGSLGGGDPYSAAQAAAEEAIRTSIEAGVKRLEEEKNTVVQSYDDLAKQAYSQYRQQQATLPKNTAGLASGVADSLTLQGQLNYQNAQAQNERQRQNTLRAIDSDIEVYRQSGDISMLSNTEKYALMTEQYRQQQEEMARQQKAETLRTVYSMANAGYTQAQIENYANAYGVDLSPYLK